MIALAVMILIYSLDALGFFHGVNNYVYDLSFRLRGDRHPSGRIIIAAIDEKTLGSLGRWPLRRSHYAEFLDKTNQADAVGFDVIMSEPSDDDAVLAQAIKRHGRVILPVYIDTQLNQIYPLQMLSPRGSGHIHIEQGVDGVAREVFNTLLYKDSVLLSFASEIYSASHDTSYSLESAEQVKPSFRGGILQTGLMKINYYGPPGTFQHISFSDIISGVYPASFFRNRTVLAGITAAGVENQILTPFAQKRDMMSGVEVHANILNNLIDKNSIRDVSAVLQRLLAGAVSILCYLLFMRSDEKRSAVLCMIILLLTTVFVFILFVNYQLWLTPALLHCSVIAMFVLTYVFKLDDATIRLDNEYLRIADSLRWKSGDGGTKTSGRGLAGFFSTGGINAKIGTLNKITEHLIFEKKLTDAALFSDMHGVALFDPGGALLILNNRIREIFNSHWSDTTLGSFVSTLSPYITEETARDMLKTPDACEDAMTFTLSLTTPQKLFFKADMSRLSFNGAKYLLFVLTDITKLKEMEILKGQIVSMVSHELKQPLSSIVGYSGLLEMQLSGEQKDYAKIITRETMRMSRFINMFLDVSRLESGKQEIRRIPVKLTELIRETIESVKPVADERKTAIREEMPRLVTVILIDPDLTKQCILNLLDNAMNYSPPDKEVVLRLTEEKEHLRIDVIDRGYGIRESEMGNIFDKFYRGKSAETSRAKGSGLGLAFIKEAMGKQGGSVSVISTIGEGSTFTLKFPKTV